MTNAEDVSLDVMEHVSRRRAWYVVGLLTCLYALSYLDRYTPALLGEPIHATLGTTDAQLGLLIGPAFAILYALIGVPIAWWLDTHNRRNAIALGALLWSAATIVSGFAGSFAVLLALRAAVAMGEAVLTPGMISMIGDTFPPDGRAKPTTIYTSVSGFMGTGAFVFGAAVLGVAGRLQPSTGIVPWRLTFAAIGLPGVILTLVLLTTVREPARRSVGPMAAERPDATLLDYLAQHRGIFSSFYFYIGMLTTAVMATAVWMPTILIREHGRAVTAAGYLFGTCATAGAIAGMIAWGVLARRAERLRTGAAGLWRLLLAGVLVALPCGVIAPLMGDLRLLLPIAGGTALGFASGSPLPALMIQTVGPSAFRARLVALSLLFSSVIGGTIGPLSVPLIVRASGDRHWALSDALSLVCGVTLAAAAIALLLARASFAAFREPAAIDRVPLT